MKFGRNMAFPRDWTTGDNVVKYLFFAAAMVFGVTCLQASEFVHVRILGVDGVIVPKASSVKSGLPVSDFWTPEKVDLEEIERSLPAFLRREVDLHSTSRDYSDLLAKAPHSRRQYIGMVIDGKRVVWVNCIPEKSSVGGDEFADWDSKIIQVKDGGSDFWGVIFDMDTHSFDKLIVNGTS
jgi:hypothetical protein